MELNFTCTPTPPACVSRLNANYPFKENLQSAWNTCGNIQDLVKCFKDQNIQPHQKNTHCPSYWETAVCWPATQINTTRERPCHWFFANRPKHAEFYATHRHLCTTDADGQPAWAGVSNDEMAHCSDANAPYDRNLPAATDPSNYVTQAYVTPGLPPILNGSNSSYADYADYSDSYVRTYIPTYDDYGPLNETTGEIDLSAADAERNFNTWYAAMCTQVYMILSSVSLVAICVALITFYLLPNKCVRIYLHINLLLSFFFRYIIFVCHEYVYNSVMNHQETAIQIVASFENYVYDRRTVMPEATMKLLVDVLQNNCSTLMNTEVFERQEMNCQIYETLLQLAIMCNHIWALIQGLYLFFLYKDGHMSNQFLHRNTLFFVVIGWGFPLFLIGGWTTSLLILKRDTDVFRCHAISDEQPQAELKLINLIFIKVPLMIAVSINACIVGFIINDLHSKLKRMSSIRPGINCDGRTRRRLTKATLSLIPLLDIHYFLTLLIGDGVDGWFQKMLMLVEVLLGSTVGLWVAVLYGIASREVKYEVKQRLSKISTELQLTKEAKRRGSGHRMSLQENTASTRVSIASCATITPTGSYVFDDGTPKTKQRYDGNSLMNRPRHDTMTTMVSQRLSSTRQRFDSINEAEEDQSKALSVSEKTQVSKQISSRTDRTDVDLSHWDADDDLALQEITINNNQSTSETNIRQKVDRPGSVTPSFGENVSSSVNERTSLLNVEQAGVDSTDEVFEESKSLREIHDASKDRDFHKFTKVYAHVKSDK